MAIHAGAHAIPIDKEIMTLQDIKKYAITDDDVHHAPTKLIVIENTINGKVMKVS